MLPYDLRLGDCLEVLDTLEADSVDGLVCDPPYHLESIVDRYGGDDAKPTGFGTDGAYQRGSAGFMGKAWDGRTAGGVLIAQDPGTWRKAWRVLKPGAYLFAFSATRTQHRMVTAIEDAGFIIHDQIAWMFGSGMPHSHKLSVYLERRLAYRIINADGKQEWLYLDDNTPMAVEPPFRDPEAELWWGWGTDIKPAWEPVCMAQKPLRGGLAANTRSYGVGALNIEAARIPGGDGSETGGRWPANVAHDGSPEVMDAFAVAGDRGAASPVFKRNADKHRNTFNAWPGNTDEDGSTFHGDAGSPARFFFCAKATRRDRNEGCDELEEKPLLWSSGEQSAGTFQSEGTNKAAKNHHPTVKPVELMRWLIRLAVPKGGLVLDPFMGSGSTGKACMAEGMRFIGIEMDADYMKIAQARVGHAHALAVKESLALSDPKRQLAMF